MKRYVFRLQLVGEPAPRDLVAFASHEGGDGWRAWMVRDAATREAVLLTDVERREVERIVAELATAQALLFAAAAWR